MPRTHTTRAKLRADAQVLINKMDQAVARIKIMQDRAGDSQPLIKEKAPMFVLLLESVKRLLIEFRAEL